MSTRTCTHFQPRNARALLLGALLLPALSCARSPRQTIGAEEPTGSPSSSTTLPAAGTEGARGMVVSASAIASAVGRDVLASGGNAVDAAIATGFALAVTYPVAGNIGGGGFMVIRFPDGRATTIDFREIAPAAATPEMFLDSTGAYSSRTHHNSYRAVGVPGTVAGFAEAHAKYGTGTWRRLVAPAASLADTGFRMPAGLVSSLNGSRRRLSAFPATLAAYYKADGAAYTVGERLRLRDLAATLGRVRDQGRDGFYKGETARLVAETMRRNSGIITEADLAAYVAKERAPVRGTYKGYEVISMPPPSSGGVAIVEMLNILEGWDLRALGHNSPAYLHRLAEAMRVAFRDRARHIGDPDFTTVPVTRLTAKGYADSIRRTIDTLRAMRSAPEQITLSGESDQTTHYSVVDASGMAVSVTYTLEAGYGLGAVVEGAGFLLNNEMGDFNGKPGLTDSTGLIGTPPNIARPGKRMLSSMTPTILARDGRLVAVIGSPGGRTIINTVLQVALNVMAFDMPIGQAVDAPRMHHQWLPDRITIERTIDSARVVPALQRMGHRVTLAGGQGTAHSILVDRTGRRIGAPDMRDTDAGAAGH